MKKTKVEFIKTVRYFCLGGIAVLGLITIIATGGGGGSGGGGPDPETDPEQGVTVTGIVDDGIPNAFCVFVNRNGVQPEGAYAWANDGRFSIIVPPDEEGYIKCSPDLMRKLTLCTFLSTKGYEKGEEIPGEENVTPTTMVVAGIIAHDDPADPQARKLELLNAIENEDPELNLLVSVSSIMWNAMLNAQINVNLGGEPSGNGDGDGDSGGAGGDTGDGADFSPIPNAPCDFALELEGDVLYSAALDDLRDGELNRPDLAAIKEEVEEKIKDLKSEIKIALDNRFPDGVGIPYSDITDENGRYFLPIPPNVQGYVRCSPPDQPKLKLATLVPELQEGEKKDDQDMTPATTFFSHSIATELSGDLDTVKENYLYDIAGLGDIQIIKEGEMITEFKLKETSDPSDKDVGLVAFSAASLFNILYKNGIDVDYLAALDGLIDNQEVRSEDLEELGVPEADAEEWAGVVNDSNDQAGVKLGTNLNDALSTARIKVTVLDELDGEGILILGAEVDITDAPSGVVCENCPGETDENGEVTLTLTGVLADASEITVVVYNVSGFEEKTVKTEVVSFATVDLEIVMTPIMFLLQVTESGSGGGTVTSSPAGINCGTDCSEEYREDTVVSLTAQANTDSNFAGWSGGGCSGTGDCTVTMNQAHTVIATFTLQAPTLISPENGATLDNNCEDYSDSIEWDFNWSDVTSATQYNIYVIPEGSSIPLIDTIVSSSSYHFSDPGDIPDSDRFNWTWMVRAGNDNDQWSEWSEVRYFDVEPLNTDCPITHTLTPPANTTVPQGGLLGPFYASATNNTSSSYSFWVYPYIGTPDGAWNLMSTNLVTVDAGETSYANNGADIFIGVSTFAQTGTSYHRVNVYDTSYNLIDQDSFSFEVTRASSSAQLFSNSQRLKMLMKAPDVQVVESGGWKMIMVPRKR